MHRLNLCAKFELPKLISEKIEYYDDVDSLCKESAPVIIYTHGMYLTGVYSYVECIQKGEIVDIEKMWILNNYENIESDKEIEDDDKWAYIE